MGWEMETEEVEAVLEKIWDLHDKISDTIHSISRSHFLKTMSNLGKCSPPEPDKNRRTPPSSSWAEVGGGEKNGFVYVKKLTVDENDSDAGAMAEARSLTAIRSVLENLEDHLEFFHTFQTQQRAEQDAALARLEQSRIILAMRLADHHGKKYKVIEEALAFVGDVDDAGQFVSPKNLYDLPGKQSCANIDNHEGRVGFLVKMLLSSLSMAKQSLGLDRFGGVLANAAVFAVSMLALMQLQQVGFKGEAAHLQGQRYYGRTNAKIVTQSQVSSRNRMKQLNVLSARG